MKLPAPEPGRSKALWFDGIRQPLGDGSERRSDTEPRATTGGLRLPNAFRSLRYRDFRAFFAAQTISQIGNWMHSVAQAWLILSLTNSPLLLGVVNMLQWGPMLFGAIPSGAVADRVPKRRLLMATQAVRAGAALTLAALVVTGTVAYWHICVLALCAGLANTLDNVARQSFVIEMVGPDDVGNAVALNSVGFNSARIVGPAVGGIVIAVAGVAPAFAFSGTGYLLVCATLATLDAEGLPRRERSTTIRHEMAEGVSYALRTPEIRALLAVLFVISFCAFNFGMWVPLMARNVLGQGAEGLGFLVAAVGVGAVAGAFTVATVVPQHAPLALLHASAAVACAVLVALSLIENVALTAIALFLLGYASVITSAGCNTGLQLASSDELRGRIMGLYMLIHGGCFPIAAFLIGVVAERWSVSAAFCLWGVGGLAILVVLVGARRRPMLGSSKT